MVINVPSELYRYSIDAELQRSDVAIDFFSCFPAGTQRWINVETMLYSYVESTLILSWIWKLKQRWTNVTFQRWKMVVFNVEY